MKAKIFLWMVVIGAILLTLLANIGPTADGNPNPAGVPQPTANPKCFMQGDKCFRYTRIDANTSRRCVDNRISWTVSDRCQGLRGSMLEQRRERNWIPAWKLRLISRFTV